ncbi:MAG TPA: LysR family transcriptional regulator [Amycolatopsis sp.]|jgi:DNA-binding transcriptional LysR family regulator
MTISLRQLEYFVTVVDEGSFTRAADVLHVSQPGLSHQILALERQLGGPLLERLPRKVRLTPAGRTVLPHARASLAHAQRVSSAAQRASGIVAGELHIGTLFSISVGVLPSALAALRRDYPEIRAQLVEFRHTHDLIAAMDAGLADLAVGPVPLEWEGPILPIGVEEFVVVGPAGDSLGGQSHVRLADLADREFVHFTAPSGLSDYLDQACAAAGFQPKVSLRTEQGPSAINMARAGLGLTLVPSNIIPPGFDALVLRPDPPVNRELCVYTRVRPDPVTAAFVTAIADQATIAPQRVPQ